MELILQKKRTELRKMLNWSCKNTVLQFNGKYYTQLDGAAMGSPIAPLMADVFMNWLVDNVSKIGCSRHILCRYVDDIFCAFDSKDEMDKFLHNLNKMYSSKFFKRGGSRRTADLFGCPANKK